MTAAAPASIDSTRKPWLFGPGWDLLLGCGGLYGVIFGVSSALGMQIRGMQPESFFPLLVILFLSPHYGATILRVYERRNDRRAYTFFAVHITLGLAVLFGVGLSNVWVASALITLYLTWNPWHYAGQNYGLAVMFLRRGGVELPDWLKKTLYASFILSTVFTFIVMHGRGFGANYGAASASDEVVHFISLGLPAPFTEILLPLVGVVYLATLLVAGIALARRGSARSLLPVVGLVAMQAAWFSVPMALQNYEVRTGLEPIDSDFRTHYFAWIAVTHSVQYLWVTTYFVRQKPDWPGFGAYWFKALAAGQAMVSLPLILFGPSALGTMSYEGGLYVLILAVMNLHHFILDGAIWKLRSGRIGKILIGRTDGSDEEEADEAIPRSPWPRRAVWGLATFGLLAGIFDHWTRWIDVPRLLGQGETVRASQHLDRVVWLGTDSEHRRAQMASFLMRAGDTEHALHELERSAELRPSASAYVAIATIHQERGDLERALEAYRAGLAAEPDRLGLLHRTGELLLRMDRPQEARRMLIRAVRIRRDHVPSVRALRRANEALGIGPSDETS